MVETHKYWCCSARFSSSVDAFATVRCPRTDGEEAYIDDVISIIESDGVDFFLPVCSPASAVADARITEALLRGSGSKAVGLHFLPELTKILDDKHRFQELCKNELGESMRTQFWKFKKYIS